MFMKRVGGLGSFTLSAEYFCDSGGLLCKLYFFLFSATEHGNSQFRVIRESAEAIHLDFLQS